MIVAPSQAIVITRHQLNSSGVLAANTHVATLWKNGVETAVVVTPAATATVGVYSFSWTMPADTVQYDAWELQVIDGDGYAALVWEGQTGPIAAELDSAASAQLDGIEATVDALAVSLAGTHVTVNSRVSGSTITAYMADDFKVRSGTQLSITVDDSASGLHDKLVAIGVANLAFGASRDDAEAGEITGTIASLAHATGVTTIVVEVTACGSALEPDRYTYQVQSSQTQGSEEDDYIELEGMLMLRQRTVAPRG